MGQHYTNQANLSRIVRQIFLHSDVAILAYQQGILNLTAYARQIHSQVEERVKQKVKLKTIATLLSRHAAWMTWNHTQRRKTELLPEIKIARMLYCQLSHHLAEFKINFAPECREQPQRFLAVLIRLAVFEVTVFRLEVNNGCLRLVVVDDEVGLAILGLRTLCETYAPKRKAALRKQWGLD